MENDTINEQPTYKNIYQYQELNSNANIEKYLTVYDLDNSFKIYTDKNNRLIFNYNSNINIIINSNNLYTYMCKSIMQWPLISYNIYGTTRLSWLLQKINNVKAIDIFKNKKPGDIIYYIDKEYVSQIVEIINNYDETSKINEL